MTQPIMSRLARLIQSAVPWREREDRFAALPLTGRRQTDDDHDDDDAEDEDLKDVEHFGHTANSKKRRLGCGSPSLRKYLSILLPFYLAAPLGLTDRKLPATHATTYLNGIRGLACWAVLNHHLVMGPYAPWIFRPYGSHEPDLASNQHFWQLPWFRSVHTGKGMVCIFFALSGYVLAYSPARKMNAKGPRSASYGDEMLTSLASSTLRRAIRLFGPMLVVVFLMALQTYYCWWAHNYKPLADSVFGQVYAVWLNIVPILNPYRWDYVMPVPVGQTWTLGFEYRLSLLLFLVTLSVSRVSAVPRKLIILSVMVWGFYCDRRWDVFAFLGGSLVAECRFAPIADDVASVLRTDRLRPHRHLVTFFAVLAVAVGLLFCSVPEEYPDQGWPYNMFWSWTLPKSWVGHHAEPSAAWIWWYGGIGSVILLWGVEQLPLLQRALAIAPFSYLGEISYAFYLLQNAAAQAIGWPFWTYAEKSLGWSSGWAFALYYVVTQIACLTMADYFWRSVDLNFVVLARLVVVDWLGVGRKDKAAGGGGTTTGAGLASAAMVAPVLAVPAAAEMTPYSPVPEAFALQGESDDDDTLPVSERESIENKPARLID
ncbi:acyltransferase family-domain-containing protein [Microdochium trichocladiopsis]|uniref:Acyltransferase family-domain-containing protein n=1 Tax=Microdochium trichocladiopsis TaxID=1682393 RepID=A0A9P8XSB8_9PEZI|nr:acyltransferase family-domain-containing protein [Microdochium trichocladiopsis]KAH7014351.1 acyltransferase family-domain-containing protein [Microdochium trichocladiopsis]